MAKGENPFFSAATEVGQELFKVKRKAEKAQPVEFGMQPATREQWRERLRRDKAFRQVELQRLGLKDFLRLWGKQGGRE